LTPDQFDSWSERQGVEEGLASPVLAGVVMGGSWLARTIKCGSIRGCERVPERLNFTREHSAPEICYVAYSTDLTNLLTVQLTKFATLNRHQLAGHVANLDFWLAETRHCLDVLDDYRPRFERLKAAQAAHVARHRTVEFDPGDPCCTERGPTQPRPLPEHELKGARRAVRDAAYRLLVRCFNENMIDESALRQGCEGLGIGVEATDLKRRD
jgi:hypothetical protein